MLSTPPDMKAKVIRSSGKDWERVLTNAVYVPSRTGIPQRQQHWRQQ
jgi:hypothetical protein